MRNTEIEQWLDTLELTWTYEAELAAGDVDEKASLRNQARAVPVDPDVVERYAEDMRRGDRFPPVIVRQKNTRLVVLGGNHRYAAARAAKAPLDAYVVVCSDECALRISYEDNRRHGLPPSPQERTAQALHLVALGYQPAAAARLVGITHSRLQRAQAADAFTARTRTVDTPTDAADLPESSKSRLMAVRADPIFAAATRLVCDAGYDTQETYRLVTELNATRSEAAALQLLDKERLIAADRIHRRTARVSGRGVRQNEPARAKLLRLVTDLGHITPAQVAATTLPDQRRAVFAQLRKAFDHLAEIDTELRRAGR